MVPYYQRLMNGKLELVGDLIPELAHQKALEFGHIVLYVTWFLVMPLQLRKKHGQCSDRKQSDITE